MSEKNPTFLNILIFNLPSISFRQDVSKPSSLKEYKFKNEFPNFLISLMHLYRIIKDNYISLKLLRLRHEPIKRFGKNINIKEKLNDFYKEIEKYKLSIILIK